MKIFEIRHVTEGEHQGKLGVFEDSKLVGLGRPKCNEDYMRSAELLYGAEHSMSPARRQFGKLVRERMETLAESFACAELNLARTDEGMALWEKARLEEMR